MINVFIGYDAREAVAYSVLAHSVCSKASQPVSVSPLMLSNLKQQLTRDRHALQSTDFAFSRFLVPLLSGYSGWSVFMDCDMLMRDDIARLWALRDERYAVLVVKHDHQPREQVKFLGHRQTSYPKKNWSSVILFNNARCKALNERYVNSASGLELHQFKWLDSEDLIGALPGRWNHLVGYDPRSDDVSLAHFTLGGPYFPEYQDCEFASEWRYERERMLSVSQRGVP